MELNIDNMAAGSALDKLVAEKVMGWHTSGMSWPRWVDNQNQWTILVRRWQPSRNIAQAFEVVGILVEEYWLKLTSPFDPKGDNPGIGHTWNAGFTPHGTTGWNRRPDWRASGETPALAICRAALKVRMQEPTL